MIWMRTTQAHCVEVLWVPVDPSRPSQGHRGGQKGPKKRLFSPFGCFGPRKGLRGACHQNVKVSWGTETVSGGSNGTSIFSVWPPEKLLRGLTWAPRPATEGPRGPRVGPFSRLTWHFNNLIGLDPFPAAVFAWRPNRRFRIGPRPPGAQKRAERALLGPPTGKTG